MPDESKYNPTYSAADIERYLTGKMPPPEMHLLERAALDDPFLADALEGYAFTQTPAQDAAALKGELEKKMQPAKVVVLKKSFSSRLWKAAALILFVAGAGVVTYQYNYPSSSKDMALQKSEPTGQNNGLAAPVQFETTDSAAGDAAFETYQEKEAAPEAASAPAPSAPKHQNKPVKSALAGQRDQSAVGRKAAATADTVAENTAPVQGNEVTGATAGVHVAESKAPAADQPSSTGDTETVVTSYATARTKRKAAFKADQKAVGQDTGLNEVVLMKSEQKTTPAHKPIVTFEEVEPARGPSYLDEYIADNLKTPEDLKVKPGPGEITLSFDVDESGQAVNIKVEKSLCEVCDKEAVRVIKGPKWIKKKKDKKGKVNIRFE